MNRNKGYRDREYYAERRGKRFVLFAAALVVAFLLMEGGKWVWERFFD